MNIKEWLNKNKVFLAGLAQFVLISLNEIFNDNSGVYTTWIVGYSAGVAVLTYLSRNLRGQWASISMSLLSSLMVVGGLHDQQVALTWKVLIPSVGLPTCIALIGIFLPPTKDREYEHSEPIVAAKAEAQAAKEEKKNEA